MENGIHSMTYWKNRRTKMQRLKISEENKEEIINDLIEQITKAKTVQELEAITIPKDKTFNKKVKKPEIYISANNLEKMFALVDECSTECQWHGLVKRSTEKIECFYIYDILVFPQINTCSSTDTDEEEYMNWLMKIMDDEDENKINHLRLHGHSHVNMAVFSSSVDDTYQKELLANIKDDDYYIFFVLNKKRDICILVYDYLQNVLFETKEVTIHLLDNMDIINEWAKEQLKENCKSTYYNSYSNSYSWKNKNSKITTTAAYTNPYYDNDEYDFYGDPYYSGVYDPYVKSSKKSKIKSKKKHKK